MTNDVSTTMNSVSTIVCVLCCETFPREKACKYTNYTRKDGTKVQRYSCRPCQNERMKRYRKLVPSVSTLKESVSTKPTDVSTEDDADDIEIVSDRRAMTLNTVTGEYD